MPEAVGVSVPQGGWALGLLVLSEILLVTLGVAVGWPLAFGLGAAIFLFWKMGPDSRAPFLACMVYSAFTLYTGGHLTRDLGIMFAFGLCALVLALREYRRRGWTIPRSPLADALALWLAVTLLGCLYGLARGNSLKDMGVEMAGALGLMAAFFSPLWRARRGAPKTALAAVIVLTYASALFGLFFFFLYKRRLGDAWFSPIPPMGAMVLLCVSLYSPRGWVRIGAALLSFVPLMNLLLSFTRGYWLGFIAGLAALGAAYLYGEQKRGSAWTLLRFLAVAVLAGGLALGLSQRFIGGEIGSSVARRFGSSFSSQVNGNTYSNIVRLSEYAATWKQILASPVTGYGPGAMLNVKDPIIGIQIRQPFVHQMILWQWFKFGLAGLAVMFWLLWVSCRESLLETRRSTEWWKRAAAASIFANTVMVAVICATNYSLNEVFVAIPLSFLWGFLLPVREANGVISNEWEVSS